MTVGEEQQANRFRAAMLARWQFGKWLLDQREGKKLPAGLLDRLCDELGRKRSELKYRMQLVEVYPTDEALANALANHESWRQFIAAFPKKRDKPTTGKCADCGGIFPLEELTDTEDGTGKLCAHLFTEFGISARRTLYAYARARDCAQVWIL